MSQVTHSPNRGDGLEASGRFGYMRNPSPVPSRPWVAWFLPFGAILGLATITYLISFWLDLYVAATPSSGQHLDVGALVGSILDQDIDQARNTLGGLGEVMAAVLGLALTVSSIIVQLAATRFTPHITSLFFRARTNLFVLGFFVTSSVYVLWVNFSIGNEYHPHYGVLFAMLLMTASLLLLFPYFAYVFDFLDPERIIGRIMYDGLIVATPSARASASIATRQARAVQAVEHLADIGLNALQRRDKGIASNAVDALCELGVCYGSSKATMPAAWYDFHLSNHRGTDFVSLTEQAIADMQMQGTWFEWKILRQYQMLFVESLGKMRDTGYLIAIDTRRIGEAAYRRHDGHALDLAIKFFNTYLRAAINADDIRTAYNVLHQYRQLAEALLVATDGESQTPARQVLKRRATQIARFMRYYSSVGFAKGMAFVSEVIAHDIGALCELAHKRGDAIHDDLLNVFLAVDEHAETKEQEKSLRGVRRAQIKLATIYLHEGADAYARQIYADMADEPTARLRSIWQELQELESAEFWEVNDRGTNFDYLSPAQKAQLQRFFGWFGDRAAQASSEVNADRC